MAIIQANTNSYIPVSDGLVSDGTNWALCDPISASAHVVTDGTGNYYDGASFTVSLTSYLTSSTFTYSSSPPTIDGLAVQIGQLGTISGTLTLTLSLAGVPVSATTISCNISDLPVNGWIFLQFSTPVTLTIATYTLQFKTSVAGTVQLKQNTGSTDICKLLRTTSTGTAPVAGTVQKDNMFIMGTITAPGTKNLRTLTWDITSNSYPYNHVSIGENAIVNVQNSASTNYYMHMQTSARVSAGSTLNIGTSGSPMLSTSTFTMTFHFNYNSTLVLLNGSTLNVFGNPRTTLRTVLTADVAAAGTTLHVANATDWVAGDTIAIGTTSTTQTQIESKAITTVSGTTITIPAITYAHTGSTAPKIAPVIHLTRNILFTGYSSGGIGGGIALIAGCNATIHYAAFQWMGTGSNARSESGFFIQSGVGTTYDIQYNSFTTCGGPNYAFMYISALAGTVNIANNVFYNSSTIAFFDSFTSLITTGTLSVDNNTFMGNSLSNSYGVVWRLGSSNATFTNNVINACGGSTGQAYCSFYMINDGTPGTMSGNTICGASCTAILVGGVCTTTFIWNSSNWTCWSQAAFLQFTASLQSCIISMDTVNSTSLTYHHIGFYVNINGVLYFNNLNLQAGASPTCPVGFSVTQQSTVNTMAANITIENSVIGTVTGHSTGDIQFTKPYWGSVYLKNTTLGSTNKIAGQAYLGITGTVRADFYQQTNGNYAIWSGFGTLTRDTVLYSTASPSIRATPTSSTDKTSCGQFLLALNAGDTPTVSLRLRKSSTTVGDTATYNGNQPRLILSGNSVSIFTNTILATGTALSNGAWETLTGTIPAQSYDSIVSVYVDCDGTAGWINVDDLITSQAAVNLGNMAFPQGGQPLVVLAGATNQLIYAPIPITRKKVM